MKNKQYEFYGVDFKTELLLGLMTGLILILVWIGLVYTYYTYNHLESVIRVPKRIFFGSMFFGVTVSLFLLKLVSKYLKLKWRIITLNEHMVIMFKNKQDEILYSEITKMNLNGNKVIRYLTISLKDKKIKMRIGTSNLMPFSRKEDIDMLDVFWNSLESLLPHKYTNKKLNLSLLPEGTISISYEK